MRSRPSPSPSSFGGHCRSPSPHGGHCPLLESFSTGGADQDPMEKVLESFSDQDPMGKVAVVGLCQDMCPESERKKRERMGDLDECERLDGNRNQTSKFLAVKKYTKTARREAELIRPIPVLIKTIDYLLGLLDRPYDEKFLVVYNFLWDRMRAIRMDLVMQQTFGQGAITMLEQMIKLHIIAMHELCECTKGEGFSMRFDMHLNAEQMNKTFAELFQQYDDSRKKGNSVPTEKEFRGYYALLKVEAAELSLHLAKMPLEIRNTQEVLFARDAARACRTGNYITFFRLVRKATYLQACLMHAQFGKVRTQALASLHKGLQNKLGIPVAQVVNWLGMEGEDIESLFEYHGFLIKQFEQAYMVKIGPFLNKNVDYKTKCSQIVNLKKSTRIIEDVCLGYDLSLAREVKKIVSDFDEKSAPLETQVESDVDESHALIDELCSQIDRMHLPQPTIGSFCDDIHPHLIKNSETQEVVCNNEDDVGAVDKLLKRREDSQWDRGLKRPRESEELKNSKKRLKYNREDDVSAVELSKRKDTRWDRGLKRPRESEELNSSKKRRLKCNPEDSEKRLERALEICKMKQDKIDELFYSCLIDFLKLIHWNDGTLGFYLPSSDLFELYDQHVSKHKFLY